MTARFRESGGAGSAGRAGRVIPRSSSPGTNIGPRSSPARVDPGRLAGIRGRGAGVADERWFYTDDDDWAGVAGRLKTTPCPHCRAVGTLNRHGTLTGYDDTGPGRAVRGRRAFCSNRGRRPGCGRTVTVWAAGTIRRLSLTARTVWGVPPPGRRRDPGRRRPGHRRAPERPDVPAGLAAVRARPGPGPDGPVRPRAAARPGAGRTVPPIDSRPCPRPPPGHVPDRRLSHRRLPAGDPHVLHLSGPSPSEPATPPCPNGRPETPPRTEFRAMSRPAGPTKLGNSRRQRVLSSWERPGRGPIGPNAGPPGVHPPPHPESPMKQPSVYLKMRVLGAAATPPPGGPGTSGSTPSRP